MRIVGISDLGAGCFVFLKVDRRLIVCVGCSRGLSGGLPQEIIFGRAAAVRGEWYYGVPCGLVRGYRGVVACWVWSDSDLLRLLNWVGNG